jgi:hypothetical protein
MSEPTYNLACTEGELVDLLVAWHLLREQRGRYGDKAAFDSLEERLRIGMYSVGLDEVIAA